LIKIISPAVTNVAQSERDHATAGIVHSSIKSSQLELTTSDLMHLRNNAGGAASLGVLSHLTAVSLEKFYSPRDLANYVKSSEIAFPGVIVPRRGSRSEQKVIKAFERERRRNGRQKPRRHKKCFEQDSFLKKMLKRRMINHET